MVRYYGLGLLTPGVGLFHLIFSSNGIVTLSIIGDRDSMPDPAFYRECIEKSFAELFAAAKASLKEGETATAPKKASAKPARKSKASSSATASVQKPVAKKARSSASSSAAKSGTVKAKQSAASSANGKVVPISQTQS